VENKEKYTEELNKYRQIQFENGASQSRKQFLEDLISRHESQRASIKASYEDEAGKFFVPSENCPTCKQSMPVFMVNDAEKEFNTKKATELARLTEWAQKLKDSIAEATKEIDGLTEVEIEEPSQIAYDRRIESIKDKQEELRKIAVELTAHHVSELEAKIAELTSSDANVDTSEIDEKIQGAEKALLDANEHNRLVESQKGAEGRVAELRESQKKLGSELASLEIDNMKMKEELCELYEAEEFAVNKAFAYTKWKLFTKQGNGEFVRCCTPTVNGVEYASLNTASQMNVGIDIINYLCRTNSLSVPLFVDNSECNVSMIPTESQVVLLKVVEGKKLTITAR
jgi:hypothetical protein